MNEPDASADLPPELTEEHALLLEEAAKEFSDASSEQYLEAARVKYLGRKAGLVQAEFDKIRTLPGDQRRAFGRSANALRRAVETGHAAAKTGLGIDEIDLRAPKLDMTLPGRARALGRRHILTQTTELLVDVAATLGFSVFEGPEVETEENNFDMLNIPLEHPAYDPFDTFYIETPPNEGKLVLRSHTSPAQIRAMREYAPGPLRVVVPGRTYRPDKVDATHYHTFHQLEGLAVDRDITFADLRYTLELFAKGVFGEDVLARFRPSYFPFTEPSAEMDISCPFCAGALRRAHDARKCAVCKGTGWLEILGCGMVHPNVLASGGYDPERVTGFAFGMGIERPAMLRHGIRDIRLFIDPERGNDLRFLEQF